MKQIAFKRKFVVIFNAFISKIEQYLEEKIEPTKMIAIKKIQKKVAYNLYFKKSVSNFDKITSGCSYNILGVYSYQIWDQKDFLFRYAFYTDRQIPRLEIVIIISSSSSISIRDSI